MYIYTCIYIISKNRLDISSHPARIPPSHPMHAQETKTKSKLVLSY